MLRLDVLAQDNEDDEVTSSCDGGSTTLEVHFVVDENPERGNWSGRFDFILSLLGSVIDRPLYRASIIATRHRPTRALHDKFSGIWKDNCVTRT